MRTYLIESFVHGPALIDALSQEEAEQEYLSYEGYAGLEELENDVGKEFGMLNTEVISANYHKFTRKTN